MIKIFILFILVFSTIYGDEYSRVSELPSITIKNEVIIDISNNLFSYVKDINGKEKNLSGYLRLENDNTYTELKLPINKKDIYKFPHHSYSAVLSIRANNNNKITSLQVHLSDQFSKITSVGNDYEHVVGLLNVSKEKFVQYKTNLSGGKFRMGLALFFIVFITIMVLRIIVHQNTKKYLVGLVTSNMFVWGILYLIDWKIYFPGFFANTEGVRPIDITYIIGTFITAIIIPIAIEFYKHYLAQKDKE